MNAMLVELLSSLVGEAPDPALYDEHAAPKER